MTSLNRYQIKFGYGNQSQIDSGVVSSSGLCVNSLSSFSERNLYNTYMQKTLGSPTLSNNLEFNYTSFGSINVPVLMNVDSSNLIFGNFFQSGSILNSGNNWYFPYSYEKNNSIVEDFLSIIKDSDTQSERLVGSVASNLRIAFDNSDFMNILTTFLGRNIQREYSISSDNFDTSNNLIFSWDSCYSKIGDGINELDTFTFDDFYINLENNVSDRKYNSNYVQKFILGDLFGSGVIDIPFDSFGDTSIDEIVSLLSGSQPTRIVFYWGESDIRLKIAMLIRVNSVASREEEEELIRFNYNMVEDMTLANNFGSWEVDDFDNNIIFIDTLGGTLINNVFPGDKFIYNRIMYDIEDIPSESTIKLDSMGDLESTSGGNDFLILRQPININVNSN